MSDILMALQTAAGAGGTDGPWSLEKVGTPSPNFGYYNAVIGPDENIYMCGTVYTSPYSGLITVVSPRGSVLESEKFADGSNNFETRTLRFDSAGSLYSITAAGYASNIIKHNSNLSIQTQFHRNGRYNVFNSFDIDSSDNICVGIMKPPSVPYLPTIVKTNSSLSEQWQRQYDINANSDVTGLACAGTNIYFSTQKILAPTYHSYIGMLNSSGVKQWTRVFTGWYTCTEGGVAVLSDGSAVTAGKDTQSGTTTFQVSRFNSSGTLTHANVVNVAGSTSMLVRNVRVDGSDNIYISASVILSGVSRGLVVCLNSALTSVIYARLMTAFPSVFDNENGWVYCAGGLGLAKLPIDGSFIGTIGSFTVESTTVTLSGATSFSTDSQTFSSGVIGSLGISLTGSDETISMTLYT